MTEISSSESQPQPSEKPAIIQHPHPAIHAEQQMVKGCAIASVSTTMLVAAFFLMILGMIKWVMEGSSRMFDSVYTFFGGSVTPVPSPAFGSSGLFYATFGVLLFGSLVVAKIALSGRRKEKITSKKARPFPLLTAQEKQDKLFKTLPQAVQERHLKVTQKAARLKVLTANIDDPEAKANLGPSLEKLQWLHLKSLLGREHLQSHTAEGLTGELKTKITSLETALADTSLTEAARASRDATLEMTKERLRHVEDRRQRLDEIEGDIDRIEAQLDLSLERAALLSSGHRGGFQLDLATRLMQRSDLFGASMPMVEDLDAHFQNAGVRTLSS